MSRSTAALLLKIALAVGVFVILFGRLRLGPPALVPDPPSARSLEGWGDAYDPRGDCRFGAEGHRLTIEVPGSLHDLSVEHGHVDAPRVLRPVRGDFVATVSVVGRVRPQGGRTTQYAYPYHGAGLVLWQDSNHYVRLERAAILRDARVVSYVNLERRVRGRMASSQPAAIPDAPAFLRLERRGSRLIGSFSPDGERWTPLPETTCDFAPDLKVGVAAVNTATDPFTAEFEGLTITP